MIATFPSLRLVVPIATLRFAGWRAGRWLRKRRHERMKEFNEMKGTK